MLICCDIEGCIVQAKGKAFDLEAIAALRDELGSPDVQFSICSGRSVPYMESIVQLLDMLDSTIPCAGEGGAVLYVPRTDRYEPLTDRPLDLTRIRSLLPVGGYREELGKIASFTAYPETPFGVTDLFDALAGGLGPHDTLTRSIAAVDVTPSGVDKLAGMRAVAGRIGVDLNDVLAIGDAWNDLTMLGGAGRSGCPANAVDDVKQVVDYVSPFEATQGVIDIISWARGR